MPFSIQIPSHLERLQRVLTVPWYTSELGLLEATWLRTEEAHLVKSQTKSQFLFKSTPLLANGGILVSVVPHYALDDEMRSHLARNYQDVRVFMAPEQRFALPGAVQFSLATGDFLTGDRRPATAVPAFTAASPRVAPATPSTARARPRAGSCPEALTAPPSPAPARSPSA